MGETAFNRVLSAFRDNGLTVIERGDRANAQAPGHSGVDRSVSIKSIEGRVLMYCHAGEQLDDVLAAVGLHKRDLFDNPRGATYSYPDGRRVVRSPDKKFWQRGNTKGRSVFRADRIGGADTVFCVEGEQDVLAVESVGGIAVCSAMGAEKAYLFDWEPLRGRNAVVVADSDEPGRKHAAQVAGLLDGIAASVWIVEAKTGKDAADHITAGHTLDEFVPLGPVVPNGTPTNPEHSAATDDETVKTVPWPTLSDTALHGTAGRIVKMVAPHTEADQAAILVQLLAVFGATLGSGPHIVAGNDRHQAVIHPLIVGRTNSGAKGTGLGVVEAIRKQNLAWFDEFTTSGLSSAEGLIEMVRDPSGEPEDKDYDPGVTDKRLLVKETEYRSVLARCRREGNTLSPVLRQGWDGGTLRTLTRKHNKLTATDPHIVVIGHITPRELRSTLDDADLSGGTVNRMLICLSRRSRLHARLGNIPEDVLAKAGELFREAQKPAQHRGRVEFTDEFWSRWDTAYRELNRDRPDSWAADATARGVTQVLRLALLYALFDGADAISGAHLDAALALWAYAEHSARWVFSTHEQETHRQEAGALAAFIRQAGPEGRTRTEISRDYFKGNAKAADITAELTPLVHDGVLVEIRDETSGRPITRYIHQSARINEFTNSAGQDADANSCATELRTGDRVDVTDDSYEFVADTNSKKPPEQHNSSNSLIRIPEQQPTSSDVTGRALAIAARLNALHGSKHDTTASDRPPGFRAPSGPGRCEVCGCHIELQGHRDDCSAGAA